MFYLESMLPLYEALSHPIQLTTWSDDKEVQNQQSGASFHPA
jgi:hypothetical protein